MVFDLFFIFETEKFKENVQSLENVNKSICM